MKLPTFRSTMLWTAAGAGLIGAGYVTLAALAWSRYGRITPARPDEVDDLLDRFMPHYEVVERHQIGVAAPAAITLQAAKSGTLDESLLVRSIFRARELLLGARPAATTSHGRIARTDDCDRVACARRESRPRNRARCRHPAVDAKRRLSRHSTRGVQSVSRARLRKDRLEPPRRPSCRRRFRLKPEPTSEGQRDAVGVQN